MNKQLCDKLDVLVNDITESYLSDSPDIILVREHIPKKQDVVDVVHRLLNLLYPGFFEPFLFRPDAIPGQVQTQLRDIYEQLSVQIQLALHMKSPDHAPTEEEVVEIICRLLSKIPELRRLMATDVEAAFNGDPSASSKIEIISAFPGLFAVSIYRLAHELFLLNVPLIPRIMTEYAHSVTGIDIHPGATIGSHFFIDHGTGVVIGETTTIGKNVKLYQGVTLGALSTRAGQALRGVKRHPTIEDDVVIYAGASILGGETVIGHGAVIGGNAFITQSVPAGTKVSMKIPELVFKGGTPPPQVNFAK
jgi:serine O-acetyltransferase